MNRFQTVPDSFQVLAQEEFSRFSRIFSLYLAKVALRRDHHLRHTTLKAVSNRFQYNTGPPKIALLYALSIRTPHTQTRYAQTKEDRW